MDSRERRFSSVCSLLTSDSKCESQLGLLTLKVKQCVCKTPHLKLVIMSFSENLSDTNFPDFSQ